MASDVTQTNKVQTSPEHPDMVWVPGGAFRMGSEDFYPEERPIHEVCVDGFWMDCYEVTSEHFAQFVEATGYKTVAQRAPNPADFPGAPPGEPGARFYALSEDTGPGGPTKLR